jgi:hypothetical protein
MKNLTYDAYIANPAIREQFEREARQLRAAAVHACVGRLISPLAITGARMSKHTLAAAILLAGCAAVQPAILDAVGSRNSPNAIVAEMDAPRGPLPKRVATLHHDPQLILEAVARRMGIRLRPEIAVPVILLESRTPLQRMRTAAERQWGLRPQVFAAIYASAENEIYLIDDADFYAQHDRTLDDALAHELVHYLQANYLKDGFNVEWSEAEAISIQTWFRKEYMAPMLAMAAAQPGKRDD